MAQYIPKDAVIAEIERRIKAIPKDETDKRLRAVYGNEAFVLMQLLSFLDTSFEVKEIDLDKEFKDFLDNVEGVPRMWHSDEQIEWGKDIAKHFFELGMKLKNIQPENVIKIKWKPCTEIPTEHWENNPAISPLYLVKCGSVNGNPILGYAHYSYASNSWMECFHATERGMWKVLEWTDKRDI